MTAQSAFATHSDAIFKTDDGGRTWHKLAPPGGVAAVFGKVHGIRLHRNQTRGWLTSSSGIWIPTDGGTRWTHIFGGWGLPWFADDDHAWMLVNRGPPGEVPFNNITVDGGLTWKQCNNDPPPIRRGYIFDIWFVSPSEGFGIAVDNSAAPMQGYMIHTTDSGCTWNKSPELKKVLGETVQTLFFLDRRTGWLGGETHIHRTEDAGKTWTSTPFEGNILSLFFDSPNHGWLLATGAEKQGFIFESGDGGEHWSPIDHPVQLPEAWADGRFAAFFLQ